MARIDRVRQSLALALETDPDEAFQALHHWSRGAGLPGLDALGVTGDHRARAAAMAASSSSMKANPVPLDEAALIAIMEAAR